jgi:hypothetical protein
MPGYQPLASQHEVRPPPFQLLQGWFVVFSVLALLLSQFVESCFFRHACMFMNIYIVSLGRAAIARRQGQIIYI